MELSSFAPLKFTFSLNFERKFEIKQHTATFHVCDYNGFLVHISNLIPRDTMCNSDKKV